MRNKCLTCNENFKATSCCLLFLMFSGVLSTVIHIGLLCCLFIQLRCILLDLQPIFSPSVLAEIMRPDGSSTISVLSGESVSAELAHELMSIQVTLETKTKEICEQFFYFLVFVFCHETVEV